MQDPHLVSDGFENAVEKFAESVDKFARSVQLLAAISGMNAENQQRERCGEAVAYPESTYTAAMKEYS